MGNHISYIDDDGLITVWCPGCDEPHGIWTRKRNDLTGAIWTWDGNRDKPTVSPSILLRGADKSGAPRVCHSFLRNGVWEFLSDSTHHLAGRQAEVVPW